MNRQESGFNNITLILRVPHIAVSFLLAMAVFFMSCENDLEKINSFSNEVEVPVQSGFNVEIAYTDSGILKGKIITPELHKYNAKNGAYFEFPKGIKVMFFDGNGNQTSFIRSDYAKYYQKKELWEAKNNVVAKNEVEGKELYTEVLYWDQKNEKVYSDVFSKIVEPKGVFYGENGFEAEQDLSKWKLKRSSGTVNVSDEQDN